MIRTRLISNADDPHERWQLELFQRRLDSMPSSFAWVEVRPRTGYTFDAVLIGVVVAERQPAEALIEAARQRWPGLRHPPRERFRP